MFQSQPICILQAGATIDGRVVEQKTIDEIAESYDPSVYTARINADHYPWSYKYGSVLSVEKREDKLFAVLKPNSQLLETAERGQLLHTSCEFYEKFADTEKAYLTGLALTDEPASLGTTQIQLSAGGAEKSHAHSHFLVKPEQLSQKDEHEDERSLLQKLTSLLKGESSETQEQLSNQKGSQDMSKKTEELLEQSIEQNKELCSQLGQLVTCLSVEGAQGGEVPPNEPEGGEPIELKETVTKLSEQVDALSGRLEELVKLTDEDEREPAGTDGGAPYL
ncbi:GPO family capsid scaffolding protein [uncultured Vibrio sp.]|uniref:GPO family capsid scaffolding protein n=1 Tax=uncultured Vibrio sp. TaxID=114054 RepID=UPI00262A4947|nr:GPO family capsid scaffolding protein [uncultured Vibrio sp.]